MFRTRDVGQERENAPSEVVRGSQTVNKNTNLLAGGPGGALPADIYLGPCPCADLARTAVQRLNSHGFAVARSPRPRRAWPFYAHPPILTPRT